MTGVQNPQGEGDYTKIIMLGRYGFPHTQDVVVEAPWA